MVDLHIHTRCSDGGLTPAEAVGYALARGLRAIAITDHDTIQGNEEALAVGRRTGLPVIPGVELSTEWEGLTFHMLGFGLDRITRGVSEAFEFLVESRAQRNPRMISRLRNLGVDVTLEEVVREANGSLLGRPHFARVLVAKGVVGSTQDAFDQFLGRGAPAYVDKKRLPPAEALGLIHEAGGLAVLAHPGLVDKDHPGRLPALLEQLLSLGLDGIEAYYTRHTPEQVSQYLRIARERGLLITGGSDFHRSGEGGPEMGTGFGSLSVPDRCFEDLLDQLHELS